MQNPPTFVMFPCLHCGETSVAVGLLFIPNQTGSLYYCRRCEAAHFLELKMKEGGVYVIYQPYTYRYPPEDYDVPGEFSVRFYSGEPASDDALDKPGPIIIYPQKSHFTESEVTEIWKRSKGQCHICGKPWQLADRSRAGWHIDHVIPHSGGGVDSERMNNFKVACAVCNLRKGKGYTSADIRRSAGQLVQYLFGDSP